MLVRNNLKNDVSKQLDVMKSLNNDNGVAKNKGIQK